MVKTISYKLVIGNALLSTKKSQITKDQVYQYWNFVDELLPEGYYTYGNNNSFENFCKEYNFLVKLVDNIMIIDCDISLLERYCRTGVATEVIKVFDEAGRKLNEIGKQEFDVLAVPCNRAFIVSKDKKEEFLNQKANPELVNRNKKILNQFIKNNIIIDSTQLKYTPVCLVLPKHDERQEKGHVLLKKRNPINPNDNK